MVYRSKQRVRKHQVWQIEGEYYDLDRRTTQWLEDFNRGLFSNDQKSFLARRRVNAAEYRQRYDALNGALPLFDDE